MMAVSKLFFSTMVGLSAMLTLSLLLPHPAQAAKTTPSPDFEEPSDPGHRKTLESEGVERKTVDLPEGLDLSKGLRPPQEYFYHYNKALTFSVGTLLEGKSPKNGEAHPTILNVQFLYVRENSTSYEIGSSLVSDDTGEIDISRRFIFSRSTLRPYAKLGAALIVEPRDGLAIFVNWSHYRLSTAIGTEWLVYGSQSLRIETKLLVVNALSASGHLGYVVAW